MSSEVWESQDPSPLLWMATASLAMVAHLGLLQVGITTYQNQRAGAEAEPPKETKIIATALQLAGAEPPAPQQLEASAPQPEVATPETVQPETLAATAPVEQTVTATAATAPLAPTAQTVAPVATAAETPAPVEVTPEPVQIQTADAPAQVPTPTLAPTSVSPNVSLNQPGVAPLATAPAAPALSATSAPAETLETAALDAPVLEALPDPTPEPSAAPEEVTVTVAEPEQEVAPEPEPEEPQEPAPLPDLANSLPPAPGTQEEQSGVASANAPAQTTEQAQDTYDSVLDFLRGFDGGNCFAALPVLAEDGSFRFETFAGSRADLTRFRQAIEIETGTLPGTVMKPVSDAQCRALPFVTAAARYPEFQLYFDLSARDIASGDVLSGRLGNTSGGFVSLLLIDDEGVVQDLGSFLKFRPGYAGFDIPMTLKGSPVETQQILMALSTRARLKTLQSLSGQQAQDFFPKLALEILLQGGGEDVALVAFSVK